jgi:hypothetical protein
MTRRTPETFWEWDLVRLMGNTVPPRDRNDDDDDEEDDEEDEDQNSEPAVIREPDE